MQYIVTVVGFLLYAGIAVYILWLATRFVIAVENIAIVLAQPYPELVQVLTRRHINR